MLEERSIDNDMTMIDDGRQKLMCRAYIGIRAGWIRIKANQNLTL